MVLGILFFLTRGLRVKPKPSAAVPVTQAGWETEARDLLAASPGLHSLSGAADNAMAPLVPAFVALAPQWAHTISPERAFRIAVLLLLGGFVSEIELSAATANDLHVQAFLRLPSGAVQLDVLEMTRGLAELMGNLNVREALARVVASARSGGLLECERIGVNELLVAQWTN